MMAILRRPDAPAGDPAAEFETRHAALLAKLAGMRRSLNEAREELAAATLDELLGKASPGRVAKLEAKVDRLDRDVTDLETTVTRSRSVVAKFVAARDEQTWSAVAAQRATVRAQWLEAVERQVALLREFVEQQSRIAALQDEDAGAARLQGQLKERSGVGGRILPPAEGAVFDTLAPGELALASLREALERVRREPAE